METTITIGATKVGTIFHSWPGHPGGHSYDEPWVLQREAGRIERFETRTLASAEARKSWPKAVLKQKETS